MARATFCLTASLVWLSSGSALDSEIDSIELDAVLSEDDVCRAGGAGGPHCALHALQMKAAQLAESAEETDPCDTDLVGLMKPFGPDCFAACPDICAPLGEAADGFLAGSEAQAKSVICANKAKFMCALDADTLPKCKPLIEQAAKFGFKVPMSGTELTTECGAIALQAEVAEDGMQSAVAGNDAEEDLSSGGCNSGYVGQIAKVYPDCFKKCPGMCGPVQDTAVAYLKRGGYPAAKKVVCRNKGAFQCPLNHKKECGALMHKASGLGIPTSNHQLQRKCR